MSSEICTHILDGEGYNGVFPFALSGDERKRHVAVLGMTGTGKSTLLKSMIHADIEAGRGVLLLDPHGDLFREVLQLVPRRRKEDVIVFDASDFEWPPAFNLLAKPPKGLEHLVVDGIVEAMRSVWRESWGPRMENLLRNSLRALLDAESATLLGIQRMLTNEAYRERVVARCREPVTRSFWVEEFAHYPLHYAVEASQPVLNKINALFGAAPLRNIFGQVQSKIDPRMVMDRGEIMVVNVSKGRLGSSNASLLGAMILSRFVQAGMSRADVPEAKRREFFIYVDELESFATDSFAQSFSEIRKYGVGLVVAGQYLDQLDDSVRAAIIGNVGSIISFRVGGNDAAILEREFADQYRAWSFTDLSNFHVLVKTVQDGQVRQFFGKTRPASFPSKGDVDSIVRRSRQRFSSRRADVEDKIHRWLDNPVRTKPDGVGRHSRRGLEKNRELQRKAAKNF